MRKYYRNNQPVAESEAIDAHGVLKDGYSLVLPARLKDSAPYATRFHVGDAQGRTHDLLSGSRPGYRLPIQDDKRKTKRNAQGVVTETSTEEGDDDNITDAREAAYAEKEAADCNAWRGGNAIEDAPKKKKVAPDPEDEDDLVDEIAAEVENSGVEMARGGAAGTDDAKPKKRKPDDDDDEPDGGVDEDLDSRASVESRDAATAKIARDHERWKNAEDQRIRAELSNAWRNQ